MSRKNVKRRKIIKTLTAGVAASIAGCSESDGPDNTSEDTEPELSGKPPSIDSDSTNEFPQGITVTEDVATRNIDVELLFIDNPYDFEVTVNRYTGLPPTETNIESYNDRGPETVHTEEVELYTDSNRYDDARQSGHESVFSTELYDETVQTNRHLRYYIAVKNLTSGSEIIIYEDPIGTIVKNDKTERLINLDPVEYLPLGYENMDHPNVETSDPIKNIEQFESSGETYTRFSTLVNTIRRTQESITNPDPEGIQVRGTYNCDYIISTEISETSYGNAQTFVGNQNQNAVVDGINYSGSNSYDPANSDVVTEIADTIEIIVNSIEGQHTDRPKIELLWEVFDKGTTYKSQVNSEYPVSGKFVKMPEMMFWERRGNCLDYTANAIWILNKLGYTTGIVFVEGLKNSNNTHAYASIKLDKDTFEDEFHSNIQERMYGNDTTVTSVQEEQDHIWLAFDPAAGSEPGESLIEASDKTLTHTYTPSDL